MVEKQNLSKEELIAELQVRRAGHKRNHRASLWPNPLTPVVPGLSSPILSVGPGASGDSGPAVGGRKSREEENIIKSSISVNLNPQSMKLSEGVPGCHRKNTEGKQL